MGRSAKSRHLRAAKLRTRISSDANDHFPKCIIIGCGQPTSRAAKKGLSSTLCRKHLLHRQRHGSAWCPTPAAATLHPYLRSASSFIECHRNDPLISAALAALCGLMESAGPVIIATRLRGLPPDQRARIALARLREAGIKPERLLTIALAVHALIKHDPAKTHRIKEWRIVAIGKAAHRRASGYHRVWEMSEPRGRTHRTELHVYPRSSGRVLRCLGEWIEKECEVAIERHVAAVVDLKVKRSGAYPAGADPLTFAADAARRNHR